MKKKRVALIIGTRPEAIKMAPLYHQFTKSDAWEPIIISTAQHREMLDQALQTFNIKADVDLNLMSKGQEIVDISTKIMKNVKGALSKIRPEVVLVHGDTNTCLYASLASFYSKIPVGHVEAGLRTHNMTSPWPEELNRALTDRIAQWCFAPTNQAKENLLKEGIEDSKVFISGNTIVDSLLIVRGKNKKCPPPMTFLENYQLEHYKLIVATAHRRESLGRPLKEICFSIKEIVEKHKNTIIVFPVHMNPEVRGTVFSLLHKTERVLLIDPLDYPTLVHLMDQAILIITDSGGIIEESTILGKPTLVTREELERPEAIREGNAKLVGTDRQNIVKEASKIIQTNEKKNNMSYVFGDGRASQKIVEILSRELSQ